MSTRIKSSKGSLTVVSTGMKFRSHMTLEGLQAIQEAEKVYFNVADELTASWIHEINPNAEALPGYFPDRGRQETYDLWVDLILQSVRDGWQTCAVSYGHSGVFVYFSRAAIKIARKEGYRAVMLPGISTEACLLCDLLVDPAENGWQSYSANDFLRRKPVFDTKSQLVLWQLRVVNWTGPPVEIHREGLQNLTDFLVEHYGEDHEVFVYEASRNPALDPVIQPITLKRLPKVKFRRSATLYVPPLKD